jgi:predicted ATPase/transcriptional regulator with XRE-family HTH domain
MDGVASLGEWVRRWRTTRRLSQDALARRVPCAVVTVRKIEADERRPSPELAERLADALGLADEVRAGFLASVRGSLRPDRLPLATPSAAALPSLVPNNLPTPPTGLVGRARDVAEVEALLSDPTVRLVTLIGPGGVGKTHLALHVAREQMGAFADGAWFVDLAATMDAALVGAAIGQALGLRESGDRPIIDRLVAALRERELLLVLDNFEQVAAAAPLVAELLAAAPELKVLVTSRAALRLRGEHEFLVSPLALPDLSALPAPDALAQVPSVELFGQRARTVKRDFALTAASAVAVAEICVRLDGLPLAVELAAAQADVYGPQDIASGLRRWGLGVLVGGQVDLPPRQRTMRHAIAWSDALLLPEERQLFRRVAVFAGGFTLAAAQAVCHAAGDHQRDVWEGVAALVRKSLLRRLEAAGEARFELFDTIHEYTLEQLQASGEAMELRMQHARHFAAAAEAIEPRLTGPDQASALESLAQEHKNLSQAVRFAVETRDAHLGARLGAALWRFWWSRGHLSEGVAALNALLAIPPGSPAPERGRALFGAGILSYTLGDPVTARRRFEEALAAEEASGGSTCVALALYGLALVAQLQGEYGAAHSLAQQSLPHFRRADDRWGIASALLLLGDNTRTVGDKAGARALYEESLALWRDRGDQHGVAEVLLALGHTAMSQSDYDHARVLYEESLACRRALGHLDGVARALSGLGRAAAAQGDYEAARRRYNEGLQVSQVLGDRDACADALLGLGGVAINRGDFGAAHEALTRSLVTCRETGNRRGEAHALVDMARLALAEGDLGRAQQLGEESLAMLRELGGLPVTVWSLVVLGTVARRRGDHRLAGELLGESLASLRAMGSKTGVGAVLLQLGCVERDAGASPRAGQHFLEAAETFRALGRTRDVAICLIASAKLLAPMQPGAAARLAGAGAAQLARMDAFVDAAIADERDDTASRARAALGDGAFEAAWSAGAELFPDRAVSELRAALAGLGESQPG